MRLLQCLSLLALSLPLSLAITSEAVEVEKELLSQFQQQGDVFTREDVENEIGPFQEPPQFRHYNYRDMTAKLKDLAFQYPNLTHLYSIGKSVQGRELWVLVVSKYAKEHQRGIPEFKYVANMHGNEVSGRVFLIDLAWTLLTNHDINPWMNRLLSTTRIHLMPTMNPDGYERAREGDETGVMGRKNANGKDLNRNFPSRFPNFFPSSEVQPETRAVMQWIKSTPFILSANLHGGTTIVNYPFDDAPSRGRDHKYTPAPDNELFVRLAYSYSRTHERMWKSGPRCIDDNLNIAIDPQEGITNGAEWYIVPGGMQDWNYLNSNCFELTVEINCVKFPRQKDLPWLWNENKYSLLHFIDQIHNAIHGRISDAETGEGIANVTISIDNKSKIVTSYGDGEFWRLVNMGMYEVTFDHPSYHPLTHSVSITRSHRAHKMDVELTKLASAQPHKVLPLDSTTTVRPSPRPSHSPRSHSHAHHTQPESLSPSLSILLPLILTLLP